MITIRTERKNGHIVGYTVTGHAEYDEHGRDIICAAVSAITLTAAVGLQAYANAEGVYETEAGRLKVQLSEDGTEQTDSILETMVLGLREVERQAPEYVKLIDNRR